MTARRTPSTNSRQQIWAVVAFAVVALVVWLVLRNTGDASVPAAGTSAPAAAASTSMERPDAVTDPSLGIDPASGLPYIAESALPPKAHQVLAAIRAGGPYEFSQDGGVFGNFEGVLPKKSRGYYREFTVKMPGDRTRGAHRLVTGKSGEIYWTADHYQSFSVVKENA